MIYLQRSLEAWESEIFDQVLKEEISGLGVDHLPLQQGLSSSSTALDHDLGVLILSKSENDSLICIELGVFYSGIVSGCSCADDPSPDQEQNEYCEISVKIAKEDGEATIALSSG
ncbi:MAG: hypothetical protein U9R74_02050 [Pseudomonadota bacterium]|nr:hypothetical protein [Pseudomonadota bacterium]